MVDLLDTSISEKFREVIENANHIAVIPSKVAGINSFCAAVGLYHMLIEKDKRVSFVFQGKVPEQCESLISKESIISEIGSRELLVSIDYSGTPASKVHYSTDNDVLSLKISPVDKNFDLSRVKSRLSGSDYDVIITVGANELYDLGQTYQELSESFRTGKVLNIDNTERNTNFGNVNVVDATADNLSMVIYKNAVAWDLTPNSKSAKALLTGMTYKEFGVDK